MEGSRRIFDNSVLGLGCYKIPGTGELGIPWWVGQGHAVGNGNQWEAGNGPGVNRQGSEGAHKSGAKAEKLSLPIPIGAHTRCNPILSYVCYEYCIFFLIIV